MSQIFHNSANCKYSPHHRFKFKNQKFQMVACLPKDYVRATKTEPLIFLARTILDCHSPKALQRSQCTLLVLAMGKPRLRM